MSRADELRSALQNLDRGVYRANITSECRGHGDLQKPVGQRKLAGGLFCCQCLDLAAVLFHGLIDELEGTLCCSADTRADFAIRAARNA